MRFFRIAPALLMVALVVLAIGLYWAIFDYSSKAFKASQLEAMDRSLDVHLAAMRARLDRYPIPLSLLAEDNRILAALDHPYDDDLQSTAAETLARAQGLSGASLIVLMLNDGTVIASTEPQTAGSDPRIDVLRRSPAFGQASRSILGRAFKPASSADPNRAYLFMRRAANRLGVIGLLINVDEIELVWALAGDHVRVADASGRIILARPATEIGEVFAPGSVCRTADNELCAERVLQPLNWMVALSETSEQALTQARQAAASASLAFLLLGAICLIFWQHRANNRRASAMQRALAAELRNEVASRTVELENAQDQLIQSQRLAAVGEMVAGVSHEINQPLAAMRTYADNAIALMERNRHADAQGNLNKIVELMDRVGAIISQLKSFVRPQTVTLEATSLAPAIRSAVLLVGTAKGLDENAIKTGELPNAMVFAEPTGLQQILVNLLANALDASNDVEIRAACCGAMVVIDVEDCGGGIEAVPAERVFEPFVTTKSGGGMGLGLAISKRIAESFEGKLEVAKTDAYGTVMRVTLRKRDDHGW